MTSDAHRVQQLYRDFNARNMEAVLSMLAEDVLWANGMEGGHLRGREAVREYWTKQWSMIDPHVEPVEMSQDEVGSTVVQVHQTVRDLRGQLLLDERVEHVFRTRDGCVSQFDIRSASRLSSVVHGN